MRNIVKDFRQATKNPIDFYEDLYAQSKDLDISIVVNNIGTGSGECKFLDIPLELLLNELSLNLFPISFISRLYLPKLCYRPQGGAIINLSSVMAYIIMPKFALYCAEKAFDHVVTIVSSSEIKRNQYGVKIDIMSHHPGYLDTPFTANYKNKPLEISKYECAEAALKCLGSVTWTSGHKKHLIPALHIKALSLVAPLLKS